MKKVSLLEPRNIAGNTSESDGIGVRKRAGRTADKPDTPTSKPGWREIQSSPSGCEKNGTLRKRSKDPEEGKK